MGPEFASLAKVSVRTYQRIEHGETAITVPFLFQLCELLDLNHLAEGKLIEMTVLGESLRPHLDRELFVFPHIA